MRAYAAKLGGDADDWGIVGLVHDFDYERYQSAEAGHPFKGAEVLRARGYPEFVVKAILSHADYSGVPRETPLEKTLFACDELAGFLTACSYVKPNRSIHEVEAKSVRKKLKDKAFARSVNRDDIVHGAAALEVDLDEHIQFCIDAMKQRAAELGLAGTQPAATAAS